MNNLYYIIWADAIERYKKFHPGNRNWKTTLLIFISWINGINWWIIFIWLKYFKILTIPLIIIDLFPGKMINSFFAFTIEFVLPFGIINYFLIFYKNRYIRIVKRYNNIKTKYALIYSLVIVWTMLFSVFLYGALSGID